LLAAWKPKTNASINENVSRDGIAPAMSEDRFLTTDQVKAISADLEAGGFKHVLALHKVDPEWRRGYRSNRPELEGWMWSVRLGEDLIPMARVQRLIEICQRHGLVFWMGGNSSYSDEGSGVELYLKIKAEEIP
jgi:hypothetical protein